MEGFCIAYFLNPKLYLAMCLLLTKTILDKINLHIHIVDTDGTSKGKTYYFTKSLVIDGSVTMRGVTCACHGSLSVQLNLKPVSAKKNVVYFLTLDFSLSG